MVKLLQSQINLQGYLGELLNNKNNIFSSWQGQGNMELLVDNNPLIATARDSAFLPLRLPPTLDRDRQPPPRKDRCGSSSKTADSGNTQKLIPPPPLPRDAVGQSPGLRRRCIERLWVGGSLRRRDSSTRNLNGRSRAGISAMSCLASWYPVDSLSSLLHTDRFLGDARFDLQINNIPLLTFRKKTYTFLFFFDVNYTRRRNYLSKCTCFSKKTATLSHY